MTDLTVCGGGVIGLSIAYEAAKRKAWRVRLIESRTIGSGASWAGAGILPPGATLPVLDPIDQLRAASHAMFPDWVADLEKDSKIDVGYFRSGGVYLARSLGERATLAANEVWWHDQGIAFERWSCDELFQKLPQVSTDSNIKSAWYLPEEHQVRNPKYVSALKVCCEALGVEIRENEAMVDLRGPITQNYPNEFQVVTNLGYHLTQRVCITTGAWTKLALKNIGETSLVADIYPVRGQMVLFRLPERRWLPIINEGHRYLVPRADGYVLAGSSEEEVGFDLSTTKEMIADLASWAENLIPCLTRATIERTWAGLRPASIDGLPYIGPLPGMPGAYVAAGHYRHGIHFSPITAKLIVDMMTGEPTSIALEPFKIGRGKTFG